MVPPRRAAVFHPCKGMIALPLSAHTAAREGSFCILGVPSTQPTAHTEQVGWERSLLVPQHP